MDFLSGITIPLASETKYSTVELLNDNLDWRLASVALLRCLWPFALLYMSPEGSDV